MTLTEFHQEAVKIAEEFKEIPFGFVSVQGGIMTPIKSPNYYIGAKIDGKVFTTKIAYSPTAALQLFRAELEKIRATNSIDQHKEDIIL